MDRPTAAGRTDRTAAALGTIAGAATLAGAARPLRTGSDDPVVLAIVALAVLALVAFLGRRWGVVGRRPGALLATVSSVAILLVGTYGLTQGVTSGFAVPAVGSVPALLVAVVGAGLAVGAAAADYVAISGRGIVRRAVAILTFSGVGVVGWLLINVWAVVLLVTVVPLATGGGSLEALPEAWGVVLSQAGTVLGVGTAAVGYLLWTGREWSFVDLAVPDVRDVLYVAGGFVALVGVAFLIEAILQGTGTEAAGHSTVEQAQQNPEILLVLVPASILVIGPFEELLYRNVIQKSLYEYFSRTGAIVAASVPFAVVHFPSYSGGSAGASLVSLGTVLSLSLLLGFVYERTGNLLVPALVHGLYNAALFGLMYVSLAG